MQVGTLDSLINRKQKEIESLREKITSISVSTDSEKVMSSGSGDLIAEAVAKIVDLQNEINADIDRFIDLKRQIMKSIDKLERPYCDIAYARYFQYKTWEEISVEIGYCYRQTTRLHGRMLLKLKDVLECPTDNV